MSFLMSLCFVLRLQLMTSSPVLAAAPTSSRWTMAAAITWPAPSAAASSAGSAWRRSPTCTTSGRNRYLHQSRFWVMLKVVFQWVVRDLSKHTIYVEFPKAQSWVLLCLRIPIGDKQWHPPPVFPSSVHPAAHSGGRSLGAGRRRSCGSWELWSELRWESPSSQASPFPPWSSASRSTSAARWETAEEETLDQTVKLFLLLVPSFSLSSSLSWSDIESLGSCASCSVL